MLLEESITQNLYSIKSLIKCSFMKKKITLILLILALSIYTLNINVQITAEENNYRPTSLELTPHDRISITSDSDFLVFPGSGTTEDPYLIDGYNITTGDEGIYIRGTTKYFIIRNCYVDAREYGISIRNVAGGTATVINNTCNNNEYGILLWHSGSSTVANNTFTNCGLKIVEDTIDAYLSHTVENNWVNGKILGFYTNLDSTIIDEPVYGQLILVNCTNVTVRDQILNRASIGLFLYSCTYSVIINNTCSNNSIGISLQSSGSATVANNTCNSNDNRGLWFSFSGSSTVVNNTCSNNIDDGIYLYSSGISTVVNNTCSNNNHRGIALYHSGSSTVANNTCDNNEYGIWLLYSSGSTVANNTCDNNNKGISLSFSGISNVINNTCNNNYMYGIYLYSSSGSTVANNTFTNCGLRIDEYTIDSYLLYTVENNWVNGKKLGFYTNLDSTIITEPVYGQLIIVNCTNVTVRDQILNNATIGLFLHSCTSSVIINNMCSNNKYVGIFLRFSDSSTVINNTCNNNHWYGILLSSSDSSTVISNTCNNNSYGIRLIYSTFCVVTYNLLQENGGYGVFLRFGSDNNLIHHNNFVDNNPAGISQAYDDGISNTWYDIETLEGNYWSDWSDIGSYSIDGSAGAIDLYPLDEPAEYSVESTTDENQLNFTFTLLMLIFPLILTRIISKNVKKK